MTSSRASTSNRALLADAFGVAAEQLALMTQVHGTTVAVVDGPGTGGPLPEADALVTAAPGLALVVLVADCVPLLLADSTAAVVAVAHAGRRGMAGGIVAATLDAMRSLGAQPATTAARCRTGDLRPVLRGAGGASGRGRRDRASARSTTQAGTAGLDIRAGVVAQLEAARVASIAVDPLCTAESERLYSHRRDGVTGRFAGLILLAPE